MRWAGLYAPPPGIALLEIFMPGIQNFDAYII